MKSLKLLKKSRVLLAYRYFLLGLDDDEFEKFLGLYLNLSGPVKSSKDLDWFNDFRNDKKIVSQKVSANLKSGWTFDRIPELERAVLATATYEIGKFAEDKKFILIINQAVEFSKKYLDFDSYKYINKVLDSVAKQRKKEVSEHLAES